MRTTKLAAVLVGLLALVVAASFAGCGGSDKKAGSSKDKAASAPAKAPADSSAPAAKSAVRATATAVEACFTDSGDYSACQDASALSGLGADIGDGPGQVQVTDASATTYRLEGTSASGTTFGYEKTGDGTVTRDCSGDECPDGTW
jgi:hypothetical protein